MCGRFILLTDLSVIVESFRIGEVAAEYKPSGNISPGQQIAAVVHDEDVNKLVDFRWGLIPSWAKDPSIGNKMFNARAETIAEKPSFREAFKRRRCLIVADGFYEWQKMEKGKKPFHFSLRSAGPFGFAGLYETWMSPENKPVKTCTIITTDANALLKPIHDRMPVIVPKDKEALWMDPGAPDPRELVAILKPYPAEEMKMAEGFQPAR
ncbi:MAG: SOS response-associated peptidase [Thermodesulfobacteriota bacterium]